MRKALTLLAILMAILYIDGQNTGYIESLKEKNYKCEDGTLYFKNILSFEKLLKCVEIHTDEEQRDWEQSLGFTSLYTLHSEKCEELDYITNEAEYNKFKDTNSDKFIFNETDPYDLSIYLSTESFAHAKLANSEGVVYINNKEYNLLALKTYKEYEEIYENPFLPIPANIRAHSNDCSFKNKNRSFRIVYGISTNGPALKVWAARKHLWGWKEYEAIYYWKFSSTGEPQYGKRCKSNSLIPVDSFLKDGETIYVWTQCVGEENSVKLIVSLL